MVLGHGEYRRNTKMKKINKFIPFVLAATLLVGCDETINVNNAANRVAVENANNDLSGLTTYEDIFEDLYASNGPSKAAKNLVYLIARKVVGESSYITQEIIDKRVAETIDAFYSANYKKDGLFVEELLVNSLRKQGYDIVVPEGQDLYAETETSLLMYDKLSDKLVADYTDYINKVVMYDVYVELMKEEYILTVKPSYFKETSKQIRKVQYFSWTPSDSIVAADIADDFETQLRAAMTNGTSYDELTDAEFKTLVTGTFENATKFYQYKDLAKDFAAINSDPTEDIAAGYYDQTYYNKTYKDVFEYAKYDYSTTLDTNGNGSTQDEVDAKYIELYNKYTEAEKSNVTTLLGTYSNSGAYSIDYGYDLKKLAIKSTTNFVEKVGTSDDTSGTIINSNIDTRLLKTSYNSNLKLVDYDSSNKTSFLDYYDNDTIVFVESGTYYVVKVSVINADVLLEENDSGDLVATETSNIALAVEGAKALANSSTNTKSAISYYLELEADDLIHDQDLYDYLESTYGYSIDD